MCNCINAHSLINALSVPICCVRQVWVPPAGAPFGASCPERAVLKNPNKLQILLDLEKTSFLHYQ